MDNRERKMTGKTSKPKKAASEGKPTERKPVPADQNMNHMLTVVASVVVILLVVWFLANQFIGVTGRSIGSIPKDEAEASEAVSSGVSEAAASSAPEASSVEQASELARVPEKKTEGRADFQSPDSWIGKKFAVDDGANVRSGPGTNNGVIEGVSPGAKVTVIDAKYVADATWVYGIIDEGNGKPYLGWIYSYALTPDPID